MLRAVTGAAVVAAAVGFPAIEVIAAHSENIKPSASSAASGCSPKTNSGNCYEPGEICRKKDHGASGVSGGGESIVCEENDGWRWEPAS
jgi:hypothetical protein